MYKLSTIVFVWTLFLSPPVFLPKLNMLLWLYLNTLNMGGNKWGGNLWMIVVETIIHIYPLVFEGWCSWDSFILITWSMSLDYMKVNPFKLYNVSTPKYFGND